MTGLHLAQYRIDAELGRGGMGVVYRATDTKLNRTVALKVLPASALSSDNDRARFMREAQSAAQLSHPNVCHVYQVDEAVPVEEGKDPQPGTEARLFIAMEYIEGETLREVVEKGPLKLQDAVNIAAQVAEALKEAHAKEIVHRDIKSANVMLTPAGVAKVLDFGLAKTQASTMLTRMGSTLGTVAYMSPEQARGHDVDSRTDLYSLGTVLYEMVAGRLPFAGEYEQAVLYGIMNEPPEPLTSLRTGVPMQLEWVVNKLLSKEADYRYQTAADLLADLKTLDLSGSGMNRRSMAAASAAQTTNTATPDKTGHAWRWPAIAAAMLLAGLGLGAFVLRTETAVFRPTRFRIVLPSAAAILSPAWSLDGREIYYIATDEEAGTSHVRVYSLSTGESRVVPQTEGATYVSVSPDGRWLVFLDGQRNQYRQVLLSGREPSDIPGARSPYAGGQYGADGSFYFTDADFNIAAVDESGAVRVVASTESLPRDMFFWPMPSPDGTSLLWSSWYTGSQSAGTYRLRAGNTEFEQVSTQYTLRAVTANGYAFLIPVGEIGDPMAVGPFDADTGQLLGAAVPFARIDYDAIAVSPDGNLIYRELASDFESNALEPLYRLDGNSASTPIAVPPGPSNDFAAARRGNAVIIEVLADDEGRMDLYVLDLDTGVPTRLTRDGENRFPDWSPDDKYVYFRRIADSSPSTIVRRRVDGSGPVEIVLADTLAGGVAYSHPSISSDESLLLFTQTTGSGWDLYRIRIDGPLPADADDAVLISGGQGNQGQAYLSPDDRYVAFQSDDAIVVTTIDGGGEVELTVEGVEPTWSPDGSWIYFQRGNREVYRIAVTTDPVFAITGSEELVYSTTTHLHSGVHADGSVLVTVGEGGALQSEPQTWVVLNFFNEMERIAPRIE